MKILRILRGILKTAATWAAVWTPVSLLPLAVAALSGVNLPPDIFVRVAIFQLIIGAINGGVFASALAIGGRRKTFETLSLRWIAMCGAIGGAAFPFVLRAALGAPMPPVAVLWDVVTNAALGAGLASLTLAVARRAPLEKPDALSALRDGMDGSSPGFSQADKIGVALWPNGGA